MPSKNKPGCTCCGVRCCDICSCQTPTAYLCNLTSGDGTVTLRQITPSDPAYCEWAATVDQDIDCGPATRVLLRMQDCLVSVLTYDGATLTRKWTYTPPACPFECVGGIYLDSTTEGSCGPTLAESIDVQPYTLPSKCCGHCQAVTPRTWAVTLDGVSYTLTKTGIAAMGCTWQIETSATIYCKQAERIALTMSAVAVWVTLYFADNTDQTWRFGTNRPHDCTTTFTLSPYGAQECVTTDTVSAVPSEQKDCCLCEGATSSGGAPCGNGCCNLGDAPALIDIDFGAGGWSDTASCDGCNEIAGSFILEQVGTAATCLWVYEVQDYCHMDCPAHPTFEGYDFNLKIYVTRNRNPSTGACYWQAVVQLNADISSELTCPRGVAQAVYESIVGAVNSPCDLTSAVSLSKVSEIDGPCDGALPSTITIQAA